MRGKRKLNKKPFYSAFILFFRCIGAINSGMIIKTNFSIRAVSEQDRGSLTEMIHFESHVHRHLDFCPPLDWIGKRPFLLAERDGKIQATLACPPDPDCVAWIRLFAVSSGSSQVQVWRDLWLEAQEQLKNQAGLKWAAAIPLRRWFSELLEESGFEIAQRVVVLEWNRRKIPRINQQTFSIRTMFPDDLEEVHRVDTASFAPLWKYSHRMLAMAYDHAIAPTVAVVEDRLVGYQISTRTPMGGHLARLAVLPQYQHQGIGFALVRDMLEYFDQHGAQKLTVNTQADNFASLELYKNVGFRLTGEKYPVYRLSFSL